MFSSLFHLFVQHLKNEANQADSGMVDEVLSAEELCMIDETSPECNVS